jgi:hypothetical protein
MRRVAETGSFCHRPNRSQVEQQAMPAGNIACQHQLDPMLAWAFAISRAANHNGAVLRAPWAVAMPRLHAPPTNFAIPAEWGTGLIGIGLAMMILVAWWPAMPVVLAMALVMLGATGATLERFGDSSSLRPILAVHVVTYAGLYALFIGATLDAATKRGGGVGWLQTIDLAASVVPILAAAWLLWKTFRLPSRAS